jgi:hypothetical protein
MIGPMEGLIALVTFVLPIALVVYLVIVLQRIARCSEETVSLLRQLLATSSANTAQAHGQE